MPRRILLGLALWAWLAAPGAARPEDSAGPAPERPAAVAGEPALDARGWLTCEAFLRMSPASRSAYLIGLREGWQTAAGGVELQAANPELHEMLQATLQDTAGWMRARIDHAGVTYGAMLERTRMVCEREPAATAWRAWLDAIRVSHEQPGEGDG